MPPAVMDGQLYWVGSYLQCHDIQATYNFTSTANEVTQTSFNGQYCKLGVRPHAMMVHSVYLVL